MILFRLPKVVNFIRDILFVVEVLGEFLFLFLYFNPRIPLLKLHAWRKLTLVSHDTTI